MPVTDGRSVPLVPCFRPATGELRGLLFYLGHHEISIRFNSSMQAMDGLWEILAPSFIRAAEGILGLCSRVSRVHSSNKFISPIQTMDGLSAAIGPIVVSYSTQRMQEGYGLYRQVRPGSRQFTLLMRTMDGLRVSVFCTLPTVETHGPNNYHPCGVVGCTPFTSRT